MMEWEALNSFPFSRSGDIYLHVVAFFTAALPTQSDYHKLPNSLAHSLLLREQKLPHLCHASPLCFCCLNAVFQQSNTLMRGNHFYTLTIYILFIKDAPLFMGS